ncbi:MAG: hypothetical protein M1840_000763 [Geoglossum simile]|nr:MAG: hypothetical protein M1840_000763 [Geoglossum simile]
MDIPNPRRILVTELPGSGVLSLLRGKLQHSCPNCSPPPQLTKPKYPDLTGTSPPQPASTPAGLSHTLPLTTPYYKATIPIWIDQIPPKSASQWAAEYLKPDAKDVLRVLGAFMLVFRKPVDKSALEGIKEGLRSVEMVVREGCGGVGWDGVCLAVGTRQSEKPGLVVGEEEWEEMCRGFGFEFVDAEGKGRNEFGEPLGLERIKEALEVNNWATNDDNLDSPLLGETEDQDDGGRETGFSAEAAELEQEIVGLKMAIYGNGLAEEDEDASGGGGKDQEFQVEQLEAVMLRLQAVRDMSAGLPEAEREKLAAKAVGDIMKTL